MPIDMPTTPAAGGDEAQQPQAQPQAEALKPNEIRLRDGRLIAMRRTTIDDGEEVQLLLQKMGYDLSNLSPQTVGLHNALYAVASVDGVGQMPPQTADQMKGLRKLFSLGTDAADLATLYVRVQGLGDDFRRPE